MGTRAVRKKESLMKKLLLAFMSFGLLLSPLSAEQMKVDIKVPGMT
jgi:hypothetical protein